MPKFPPPENFAFSRPTEWPEWKRRFERYRIATKLDKDDGVVQVNALVYAMGPEADHIFSTFDFTDEADQDDYKKVLEHLNVLISTSFQRGISRMRGHSSTREHRSKVRQLKRSSEAYTIWLNTVTLRHRKLSRSVTE